MNEKGYVHPEVLVSAAWVAEHLNDPAARLVESNEDIMKTDFRSLAVLFESQYNRADFGSKEVGRGSARKN